MLRNAGYVHNAFNENRVVDPITTALGHICEYVPHVNPRVIEWDIYIASDTLITITHGTLFDLARETCGISSFYSVSREEWAPTRWLMYYAFTIIHILTADILLFDVDVTNPHLFLQFFFQRIWPQLFPNSQFSLMLDLKSNVPNSYRYVHAVIKRLEDIGIHIWGVGSFTLSLPQTLPQTLPHTLPQTLTQTLPQTIPQTLPHTLPQLPLRTRHIFFFHTAEGLLRNSHKLPKQGYAMFNGGSLLLILASGIVVPRRSLLLKLKLLSAYDGVRLGMYVQEDIIDKKSLLAVMAVADNYPDIFILGFAYGRVNHIDFLTDRTKINHGVGLERFMD